MQKIEGLSIGLDLDSTALNRGLTGVKDKLRTVNSEMKANMSAFDRGDRSIGKYETRLSGLNRKLEVQKEVTKQAKAEYEKMVRENGEGSKKADEAAKSYNNEVAALNNLERYTEKTREELHRLKEEQRIAESGWTKFGQRLTDTGTKLTKIGDSMKSTGRSMSMYLTAPIMGIGGLAVKVGMDFQESMSKVSAISGATGKDFESLEKQARNLGATTQFSASEAAEGMQFLAMAGFKTNDILSAMPGMLDLAAAGALELGAAADISSNIMSGFGIEASKSGHVSDVLAKAASSANTDVSQLGEAMKYLAPSAKTLGWSMEESTAAVMAMSDAGIQGSLAGQAFGSSLGRLAKPTKAMKDVLDETGISFFDAEDKMKSMPDVIAEIENGTEGMTQKQKSATLTTLFGAEAYKHWAVLLDKSSGTLEENTSMLKKADGAAKDMADTMNDNAKGDIKVLISSLQELSLQIYDILEPKIRGIIQTFTNLVVKVQQLPQPFKMASIVMAALAAAIGPLLVAGGLFIGFLGSTATGLGKLFPAIAKAGGLLKWLRLGFAALTGPVGLTIGILALLAAGVVIAYKKFEPFRNAINKLKDVFVSVFKIIVDYFKSKIAEMKTFWDSNGKQLLQALQNIFNGILFVIKPLMPILEAIFKVTFKVILAIVKSVIGNIKGVIDGGLKVIMGLIQVFSGLFTGNFSKMWTGIKNIFSGALQFIWNYMQLMFWGKMLKGILSLGKLMVNAFKGTWGSIKNVFSSVIKWIVDFVKNRFTSMKNTVNTITTTIKNLISTIWNG
ncbi:phage tail tape measure protein, partial [Peribacillus muralis]|uniref:phage tail tape measure protein n=1 Tax=Peribacillus muralis TaxID=264697 RepID=UPI003CFD0F3D